MWAKKREITKFVEGIGQRGGGAVIWYSSRGGKKKSREYSMRVRNGN